MVISTFGLLGIATVVDGEAILVANTPPHPSPLPEPPPSIIDNNNDSTLHSDGPNSTTATPKISAPIMRYYNYTEIVSVDDYNIDIIENSSDPYINGELMLLLILLFRLVYRVDRMYQVGTILSSIVLILLQSGSVHNNDDASMNPFDTDNNFSTSINGEKYTSQLKYQIIIII
jgi:hypothetical protein